MKIRNLECHQKAQDIAKGAMRHLRDCIKEGMSEAEIAGESESFMHKRGAGFWYHGVGALVLVGDRTSLSVSGKDYLPTDGKVSRIDLVTIDLSPEIKGCWGDYARSFVVANGSFREKGLPSQNGFIKELSDGVSVEDDLHVWFMRRSRPGMTFGELYLGAKKQAENLRYTILDSRGTVGHTIERELDKRIYIEEGSGMALSDAGLFTFEPHIGKGKYGFKRKDIYYFSEGKMRRL